MTSPKHVSEPLAHYGPLTAAEDANIKGAMAAMKRAALRARQLAEQTGTDLIVVRAGQVVRVPPRSKTAP
ncbi:hypothetical protein AAFF27_26190 [Xylophilus sp. GW821-FHT01B05]